MEKNDRRNLCKIKNIIVDQLDLYEKKILSFKLN